MDDKPLAPEDRARLARAIQEAVLQELDHDIGNMEADMLLDRLLPLIGGTYYNMGLRDAAAVVAKRADDIADDLYTLEALAVDRS